MYRTIDAALWTDPKVRRLKPNARYLFLYFITNPHTHVSGIYYLPDSTIEHETGLKPTEARYGIDTLSSTGFVCRDEQNELIWVVNMFRYQGNGEKNARSAAAHLCKDVHKSPLISSFIELYPAVKPFLPVDFRYPIDGVSDFGTPIPHSPFPIPEHRILSTEQDITPSALKANPPARKSQVPDGLDITEAMRVWVEKNGFITADIGEEIQAMLDHFRAKGECRADWVATWRTWMRNSRKFAAKSGGNGNGRQQESRAEAGVRKTHENAERVRESIRRATGDSDGGGDFSGTDNLILPRLIGH